VNTVKRIVITSIDNNGKETTKRFKTDKTQDAKAYGLGEYKERKTVYVELVEYDAELWEDGIEEEISRRPYNEITFR
jgi:hypothetical protein